MKSLFVPVCESWKLLSRAMDAERNKSSSWFVSLMGERGSGSAAGSETWYPVAEGDWQSYGGIWQI